MFLHQPRFPSNHTQMHFNTAQLQFKEETHSTLNPKKTKQNNSREPDPLNAKTKQEKTKIAEGLNQPLNAKKKQKNNNRREFDPLNP